MRNVMETPVTRVLAWSSNAGNAVEAEYITMEKAEGVQLDSVRTSLNDKQKVQVVRSMTMQGRRVGSKGVIFRYSRYPSTALYSMPKC